MAPPKKYIGDTTAFTYRCETEKWRRFRAVLVLLGKNPADIFNGVVDDILAKNKVTIETEAKNATKEKRSA